MEDVNNTRVTPNITLFGTSGIRGYTNIELTPEFAVTITEAYCTWLRRNKLLGYNKGKIAVGRDTRYGAEMLQYAITSALLGMGLDVINCGCLPTPALAMYIPAHECIGGILVTGSHMPPERLGLIFLDSDGSYLARDKTSAIENIYISMRKEVKCSAFGPVNIERVNVSSIGNLTTAPEDAIQYYKSKLSLFVDTSLISSVKLKILVDPGNGTACGLLASILREVGQTVVEINGVPSGKFARAPEPRAHTLKSTALQVREQSCDFGAATDTDADRVLFITSEGDVVMEDIIGAIFATATINRYRGTVQDDTICIVTPINSSSLIEHICSDLNVKLEYCRIGQPDTEEAIKRTGAVFAYEESGKYYFPKDALCCDATLATLKLLEILAERRVTLQDLMEEYPKIHQKKCAIECANTKKKTIERKIEDLLRREARDGMVRDITIDGYKRIYQDRSWLLIRISGTEPLIRVFADTLSSRERAEELAELGVKIVHDAMEAMET